MRLARSPATLALALLIGASAVFSSPQTARADHGNIATRCDAYGCNVIHCNHTGDRCVRLDRRYGYGGHGYGYNHRRYGDRGFYDGEGRYRERGRYRGYRDDRYGDDRYRGYRYRDGYLYRDPFERETHCGANAHLCGRDHHRHDWHSGCRH
jgi:hypothetical protein